MKKNVMVVDNHPVILKFMTDLLVKEGHRVETAEDGLAALDMLKTIQPDIVFVDLIMPNIDGEKFCRIIRTMPENRDVPLIVLSGVAADEEIDFASFGADSCIAKGPFKEMAQHVLATLSRLDEKDPTPPGRLQAMGSGSLYPRQITKELLSVRRHFQLILDSMTEGLIEITADARIVYANPVALSLIGIPEERLLTTRLTELFYGGDRERIQGLLGCMGSGEQCMFEDSPVVLSGRQVMVKVLPVKDEAPKAIIMLNDITERRRMEEQLQQARKMEALGTLAGGIAHSFNNALTVILGNISLAKIYARPEDPVHRRLEDAERASLRARDITQQLVPLARGDRPVKDAVSVSKILDPSLLALHRDSSVRYELNIMEELWPVSADVSQVRKAVGNVIANAVEAAPRGGAIKICAKNIDTSREPSLLPQQPGRYVEISVQDEGDGIEEQTLSRIYDPYFSTKEVGRGLGLAMAYAIVSKHEGFIVAQSEPGRGSTFRIYLPASDGKVAAHAGVPVAPCRPKAKVLVMDDEELIRTIVGEMIESLGYRVAFAEDGARAIELYEEAMGSADPFSAVIMDLSVPRGMGGKETIRRLLRMDPNVRAIVSSGYSCDPIMTHYKEYGFKGVLGKPFRMVELRDLLVTITA